MIVIGIGNEFRGDDGIGIWVARQLKKRRPDWNICESTGEMGELISLWEQEDEVILVDAIQSGQELGKIEKFFPLEAPIPKPPAAFSSHAFGLAEAIEMSKNIAKLPQQMLLWGIEAIHFDFAQKINDQVLAGGKKVIEQIINQYEKG